MVDRRILELEATRDLSRVWLHVDMDAFYAAVETLSNPSLNGKPMAVGGLSMISTANYEVCCGFQLVYAYKLYSLLNFYYPSLGKEVWGPCSNAWLYCS